MTSYEQIKKASKSHKRVKMESIEIMKSLDPTGNNLVNIQTSDRGEQNLVSIYEDSDRNDDQE